VSRLIFPFSRSTQYKTPMETKTGIASVTTMTALLALHIESALDLAETYLVRSMARISISQIMLLLNQGREIPALKRALPIFEEVLAKRDLYSVPPNILGQIPAQARPQDNNMAGAYASPHTQANVSPSQLEQRENNQLFDMDLLGFDFLGEWQYGQLDSTDQD